MIDHDHDLDLVEPGPGPVVVRLSDVTPERVEWLWHGYLPRGKLVTLDGDPGLGKSTLALDWAARVSTGSPWPDGDRCPAGGVLLLSAEDGLADTIRPRLDAAGADTTRVFALSSVPYTDDDGSRYERMPVIPRDLAVIEQLVEHHGVRLVVVDVLMAYLDGQVNAHRDQDVRRALTPLGKLAERTGACVVVLRHLNKATGGPVLYRGGGSIGIVGAARVALVSVIDPDDDTEQRRILAVAKSNTSRRPPARTYRLTEDPERGVAFVDWQGVESRPLAELMAHRDDPDERTERDDAAAWLADYVTAAGGRVRSADAKRDGRVAGHSDRTLKRALRPAGVVPVREGFPSSTWWVLRDDPAASEAQSGQLGHPPGLGPTVPTVSRQGVCAACGDPMTATEPGQTTHPTCPPGGAS